MAAKITRTLYIGLGGTGVKSILRTKQCFLDSYGQIPSMVSFLGIDTSTGTRDMSVLRNNGETVKLNDNELLICTVPGALGVYKTNPSAYTWFPKENDHYLSQIVANGAGQIRSNGRFIARFNADKIQAQVNAKVAAINKDLPLGSTFTYDVNTTGTPFPTIINIVGSVAGGTGSGMLLDTIALVSNAMKSAGTNYRIYPWIVLPDVFRIMCPGVPSSNTFNNAYGALRELDHWFHLPIGNEIPLDFGFSKVYYMDENVQYAYLINNTNKLGVTYQNIDEITDSIGRSMFLPSNGLDNELATPMDQVSTLAFNYNINNKESRYISVGSAELIYDNQAVGNVVARTIMSTLCDEFNKAPDSAVQMIRAANTWMSSQVVQIQEVNDDQLIDSLLAPDCPFPIMISKDTDVNYIAYCINSATTDQNITNQIYEKYNNKLNAVKQQLDAQINLLLNDKNGVGRTESFLQALIACITACNNQMVNEQIGFNNIINTVPNWDGEIKGIKNPFPISIVTPVDKNSAELLLQHIQNFIKNKRESIRRGSAIQFYTELQNYINLKLKEVQTFKLNLTNILNTSNSEIIGMQRKAATNSKFQIYLHASDLNKLPSLDVNNEFLAFQAKNPIADLINKSQADINRCLWEYAKGHALVKAAVNTSAEDKLREMDAAETTEYLNKVKDMASPLWNVDTQGYATKATNLSRIMMVGCHNAPDSILKESYSSIFTEGPNKPTFVSIGQTDRILVFILESSSPLFAVNNLMVYKKESDTRPELPACYLDGAWFQRIQAEKFDILPKVSVDTVLDNWVQAFIFGFIKYDEGAKTYHIRSEARGDALNGYRFDIGPNRTVAFNSFQAAGIDSEVRKQIHDMIVAKGQPFVTNVIKEVKDKGNYLEDYSNLSNVEKAGIEGDDSTFTPLKNLLKSEINYITKLKL